MIATDASPAMLELTCSYAPVAEDIRTLVLPSDPLPQADAVVSVGHALNYLPDEQVINRFVRQIATFVRDDDGSWRRDDETRHNILIDTGRLPGLLAAFGV